MAKYMTQKMSFGNLTAITYYRKQSAHPTHAESSLFTTDATAAYAAENNIPEDDIELGTYKSGQGVPAAGQTGEI